MQYLGIHKIKKTDLKEPKKKKNNAVGVQLKWLVKIGRSENSPNRAREPKTVTTIPFHYLCILPSMFPLNYPIIPISRTSRSIFSTHRFPAHWPDSSLVTYEGLNGVLSSLILTTCPIHLNLYDFKF